jgi:predicted Zn-dependent protease
MSRRDKEFNAMARPGGFLYVDQGLLSDSKAKLKARFALAHEVAHVLQRHETKELQGLIVDSFTAKDEMQKAILNAKKDPDTNF